MKLRNPLLLLLLPWLAINLIQAYFTGLFNDEAYYYFYSRNLAWGYYDHPPLLALFIKTGYAIFGNELGVRLLIVLISSGTFLVLRKTALVKNELVFAVLFFSFLVFQITGFLAIPDSLLLFFTALFFLVYQRYSKTYSFKDAILLGLVMAAMFYSKYLGIFIVFFTVLADIRLLGRKSFWLAVVITSVLFLPHLVWQYRHDFPSFYYHMLERSHDESFRWANFGDFIVGQLGQVNPLLFIPVIYFLIKFKPLDAYDRSLKVSALGFLLFPFLMMIKGRVEANWTMAGLIPLFIISYKMFERTPKIHRFLYISGAFTISLVILARLLLVYNFLPEQFIKKIKLDNYGWEEFSHNVEKLAGERPVVFVGSYQNPSQYIFQTGKEAFAFNNAMYRNNQFDLERIEEKLQGKEALIIINHRNITSADREEYGLYEIDSILYPNHKYRLMVYEPNYRSYNFINAEVMIDDHVMKAGETVEIPVILEGPAGKTISFSEASPAKVYLCYYFLQDGKPVIFEKVEDLSGISFTDEYRTSFKIAAPVKPGVYYLKISIKNGWLPPGINSRLIKVKVN
jgi:hypothetical protein